MAENPQMAANGRPTTMDRGAPYALLQPPRLDVFIERALIYRPRATGGHAEGGAAVLFDPEAGAERVQDPFQPSRLYSREAWTAVAAARLAQTAAARAFHAADAAWSAELQRLYGARAGDVRYTPKGHTGPTLAPLHAEFARARDAWHAAVTARLQAEDAR